jgi:hypothetical protein
MDVPCRISFSASASLPSSSRSGISPVASPMPLRGSIDDGRMAPVAGSYTGVGHNTHVFSPLKRSDKMLYLTDTTSCSAPCHRRLAISERTNPGLAHSPVHSEQAPRPKVHQEMVRLNSLTQDTSLAEELPIANTASIMDICAPLVRPGTAGVPAARPGAPAPSAAGCSAPRAGSPAARAASRPAPPLRPSPCARPPAPPALCVSTEGRLLRVQGFER